MVYDITAALIYQELFDWVHLAPVALNPDRIGEGRQVRFVSIRRLKIKGGAGLKTGRNFNATTLRRKERKAEQNKKGTLPYLAPEGRHVYSTQHAPKTLKPQRGGMSHLSESRISPV